MGTLLLVFPSQHERNAFNMFSSYEPKLEDILPDISGWEEVERKSNMIMWYTEKHDACGRLFLSGACSWEFDLTSLDGARDFYDRQSAENGGAMIEIGIEEVKGIEALSGIFKYRSPVPDSLAMLYVGIFWFPFPKCIFQINFEAIERGTTGVREAAVYLIEKPNRNESNQEPVPVASMEEMFQKMREKKVVRLPSDDMKYDASFPEHPLSRVRVLMAEFRENGYINPKLKGLKAYRVRK